MTKRPMKPHRDGYEDEEDCEGYYDPDELERRKCPVYNYRLRLRPLDPCAKCITDWHAKEDARCKAERDAKTPEEKAADEAFDKELRELY